MKIACITAGAGRMYCGSCLRDNALAQALMDSGHETLLIPTYTPTRTDEVNVSLNRVFLGGINVYLQQHFELFRRTPQFIDEILDSKPLLQLVTRLGISVDPVHLGDLTVSMLRGLEGVLRKEIQRLLDFLADEVRPDIIILPNSLLISLAPAIKARMSVPVCCTLQGEDLFLDGIGEPYRTESIRLIRRNAAWVDAFVAVSRYGAQSMADYLSIEQERIHVVPLGIKFDGFSMREDPASEPFTIGYLARITPEKGLHMLCEAYRLLKKRADLPGSRLWVAGYIAPEQKTYLGRIRKNMEAWGLAEDFHYHGELDRPGKLNFLKNISVLSVPESYADPKGLFLLEAMASGTPVVQPRRGAFTEIVEKTGGGILVDPDSPEDLARGFLELWENADRRRELGVKGYEGVRKHYGVTQMVRAALAVYESVMKSGDTVSI
jgi:glycosyltransferase involved in cell wall biosynthesis